MSESVQYTIVGVVLVAIAVWLIVRMRRAIKPRRKDGDCAPSGQCAGCLIAKSCHKPPAKRQDHE